MPQNAAAKENRLHIQTKQMLYLNLETYLERNCNIFPLASDHEFDAGGGVCEDGPTGGDCH